MMLDTTQAAVIIGLLVVWILIKDKDDYDDKSEKRKRRTSITYFS